MDFRNQSHDKKVVSQRSVVMSMRVINSRHFSKINENMKIDQTWADHIFVVTTMMEPYSRKLLWNEIGSNVIFFFRNYMKL